MLDRDIVNDTVCWLLGCTWRYPSDHCCDRCGVDYCDESYHSAGLLHTARVMLSRGVAYLRYVSPVQRCQHCGRFFWTGKSDTACCSERCFEVWFPF